VCQIPSLLVWLPRGGSRSLQGEGHKFKHAMVVGVQITALWQQMITSFLTCEELVQNSAMTLTPTT